MVKESTFYLNGITVRQSKEKLTNSFLQDTIMLDIKDIALAQTSVNERMGIHTIRVKSEWAPRQYLSCEKVFNKIFLVSSVTGRTNIAKTIEVREHKIEMQNVIVK